MKTELNPHPWPWQERPRVLVENPDRDAGFVAASILRDAGYSVAVCPGPVDSRCPLVGSDSCTLVDGADVIVSSVRVGGGDVVRSLRRRRPHTPLVVEATETEHDEHADVLGGCDVIPSPMRDEELLAAVRGALDRP